MKPREKNPAVRPANPLSYGCLIAALAVTVLAATTVMGIRATSWSGTSFPGFFVLPNRVVASIGQPHWAGTKDGSLYQRTVVAVDGAPVADSAEVYRRVGQQPIGTTFAVTCNGVPQPTPCHCAPWSSRGVIIRPSSAAT